MYSYQVKMMVGGQQISETFDTLPEAQTWRDLQRASSALDLDEKRIFEARAKKREAKTYTVLQALQRYEKEVTPSKKGADVEKTRIGKAKKSNLAKKSLYMVTPKDVLSFMDDIGGSDNNKRKYASLISHLFRIAVSLIDAHSLCVQAVNKIRTPALTHRNAQMRKLVLLWSRVYISLRKIGAARICACLTARHFAFAK